MENNKYEFDGVEFTTQGNVLKIKNAFAPVKAFNKKLVRLFTENLPMDKANAYQSRLQTIVLKDEQDKKDFARVTEKEPDNTDLLGRLQIQLDKNKVDIETLNTEFLADTEAISQQQEYNDAIEQALETMMSTEEIIMPFLRKYLIGDIDKLDFSNPSILDFMVSPLG